MKVALFQNGFCLQGPVFNDVSALQFVLARFIIREVLNFHPSLSQGVAPQSIETNLNRTQEFVIFKAYNSYLLKGSRPYAAEIRVYYHDLTFLPMVLQIVFNYVTYPFPLPPDSPPIPLPF